MKNNQLTPKNKFQRGRGNIMSQKSVEHDLNEFESSFNEEISQH
jgi:hypothetical protein